ncbi:MAG TPA: magnesium transporter CorA family protein [Nakamurella sp.]
MTAPATDPTAEVSVELRFITTEGVTDHRIGDLPALLARTDGVLWLDIPSWDEHSERVLSEDFAFHPLAIRDCAQRNQVPKVQVYPDHLFLVLHAPQAGAAGHVHYIELDQFVGDRYLVTVHGPWNPAVDPAAARVEVDALARRLQSGKLRPAHGHDLSYALVTALALRLRDFIARLTADVWGLEQRVTGGHLGNPEQFLDLMFRARHGLLTIQTIAGLTREVFARMTRIHAFGADGGQAHIEDVMDQFDRLQAMAHVQKDYLQGTIEFYQARTNTKMTIAAERLAVIAAVTLPVTAVSSILGMNVIVNDTTQPVALAIALLIMGSISTVLLIWAKRRGWW